MSLQRLEAAENRVGRAARQLRLTSRHSPRQSSRRPRADSVDVRSLSILEKIVGGSVAIGRAGALTEAG
jgi:hypothetical protein